ncbi:TRAP transporter small permease [Minwuia sp.]|uniref:TRAP transporter small permease n=1 Tax=Minwuia sp. TaxID=2493630 RepID=UPI003A8F9BF2
MAAFLKWLLRAESLVAALAYLIVASLLLGEIIAREIFSTTIWGSQRMAVFAAIYAGFLGLCLATAANSHLRPQFADGWWPARWARELDRIGDVISAILFIILGIVGLDFVSQTYATGDTASVIRWKLWPFQAVIVYSFFSSAVRHIIFAARPDLKPMPDITETA